MIKITAVFLASITLLVFSWELLKIKSIKISENECIQEEDVNLKSKIIFLVSTDQVKNELKNKFPCISEANVKKIYPSTLKIDIGANGPVAKIADTTLATTLSGKIVEVDSQIQLPVIYLPSNVTQQNLQIDDQNTLFAIRVASLLTKTDFRLSAIRVLEGEIVAYDTKEVTAHFSEQKDANDQVGSLQQTVATAKIDGDKIAKIDLRFDKPVITYK